MDRITPCQFTLQFRAGESHTNADSLSRRPCAPDCHPCNRVEDREAANVQMGEMICQIPIDVRGLAELQTEDPDLKTVMGWLGTDQRQTNAFEDVIEKKTLRRLR